MIISQEIALGKLNKQTKYYQIICFTPGEIGIGNTLSNIQGIPTFEF